MRITASDLDAHLSPSPLLTTEEPQYPFESQTWQVLHGNAPLRRFVQEVRTTTFTTAAPSGSNELHVTVEEDGSRVLDLCSRPVHSPSHRAAPRQHFDIRGRDVVEFVCVDPTLDVRINQGTDLEVRIAAPLLRRLALELQHEWTRPPQQRTAVVGTVRAPEHATTENTGAAQ